MKHLFLSIFLTASFGALAQTGSKLHFKAIVVDTHGDILSDQIKSGIDVGVRSIGVDAQGDRTIDGQRLA